MKIYLVIDKSYGERRNVLAATTTKRAALKYIADEMESGTRDQWEFSDKRKELRTYGAEAGRELNKILAICGPEGHSEVDTFDVGQLYGVLIEGTRLFTDLYRELSCDIRHDHYEVIDVVEAIGEYKQKKYHDAQKSLAIRNEQYEKARGERDSLMNRIAWQTEIIRRDIDENGGLPPEVKAYLDKLNIKTDFDRRTKND